MGNKVVKKERAPEIQGTFISSVLVFILCVFVLLFGILKLGLDAHIPIIFATVVCVIYGLFLKIPFIQMEQAMIKSVQESMNAMLIILVIGTLIAAWISCGTVPYIIYLGLGLINPSWFLAFVIIMCGILSSVTGSSWTTCGTIGVAFIGISIGLGIPVAITAGAVACGAYFGDKQSPISDFAIFASGVTKVNIYKHCKNMLYTTGPAFILSTVIFGIMGLKYSGGTVDSAAIDSIREGLAGVYNFSAVMWIPLIALIVTIVLKMPAIPSLFIGTLFGVVVAIGVQGVDLSSALGYLFKGFSIETGVAEVDRILNRGGMSAMFYTLGIMMCSLSMAGVFERTNLLLKIVDQMSGIVKKRVGLIVATLVTGIGMSYFAADPYIAALVPVKAYEKQYEALGIDKSVLSRTISDGAVCMCPIVPWGSSGVFTAQTLGVPVLEYMPYYFMGFITPIFTILTAISGIGIKYVSKEEEESVLEA